MSQIKLYSVLLFGNSELTFVAVTPACCFGIENDSELPSN